MTTLLLALYVAVALTVAVVLVRNAAARSIAHPDPLFDDDNMLLSPVGRGLAVLIVATLLPLLFVGAVAYVVLFVVGAGLAAPRKAP